jgi:hypothetical protein
MSSQMLAAQPDRARFPKIARGCRDLIIRVLAGIDDSSWHSGNILGKIASILSRMLSPYARSPQTKNP